MKRLLLFVVLITSSVTAICQDVSRINAQYQRDMEDTVNYPYGNNARAGRYYSIRGFKMYAETHGSGQPLLIIHGNGGSISSFIYQVRYFSQHYKVIVADSRAQGKSADPGDSLTYEMMADDYAALLSAMEIDSAFVIGWSDGGINGLLLAIRHPEKVKKLAITGANLVPDTTAVPRDVWNTVMPAYNWYKNKKTYTRQEKDGFKLMRLLVEQPHIPLTDLHKIQCPALVIGGDNDVIRPEHTFLIKQHIPTSYLWILPASGHSIPVIYKDEFNTVVDRFFSNPFKTFKGEQRFF